ncbi:hypothetical protein [Oceanicola sp. 502str15]|uniref:hypothetical protein n=1 Tax=Oceanicola sp. 502str15 TaxID=2696061 RepID=UPI0020949A0E|nr:hypothetical protein [Oceanicola sp. 502str15]MCO6381334.1 hypothetical protein [Oceanicola sp. 502str15]
MEHPVKQVADGLAQMMGERLGIRRGETLADKLRRGRRLLPRKVRREAAFIAEAEARMEVPKFAFQYDAARVEKAEKVVRNFLETVDPVDRRKGIVLGILGWLAFNFLLVAGLVIWWLASSGRI